MAKSIAIVAGSYHRELVEKMVEKAKSVASENNLIVEEISWVPGSMEVPLQIKRLFLRESIEGAAVLGIIENGETKHGLVMGQAVISSLVDLQLASMKPITVTSLSMRSAPFVCNSPRVCVRKAVGTHVVMPWGLRRRT